MKAISRWAVALLGVVQMARTFAGADSANHHGDHRSVGVQSIDVYSDAGRVHLLTVERGASGDEQPKLLYQHSVDGSEWSEAVTVAGATQPPPNKAHRGSDVQIAAAGEKLIAVWQIDGTDQWGGGPVATALSSDGGKTWSPGPSPADEGLTTGHGYFDVAADSGGAFHLVWLDSRSGQQGLRYARSADGGATWSTNQTLADPTCECCWNTLATAGDRVAVMYRRK